MTEERTYPREWFRVGGYYRPEITSKVFDGETRHKLLWHDGYGKRYTNKISHYENWYPSREEAEAAFAARQEGEAFAAKQKRMREAAPELVEALRNLANAAAATTGFASPMFLQDAQRLLDRIDGEQA
jgi:hypothetical protein